MSIAPLSAVEWRGKSAVVRADLNAPLSITSSGAQVRDDSRLRAALPTLLHILNNGGGVALLSHLGRPREGEFSEAFSLAPVARHLSTLLQKPVPLARDWRGRRAAPSEIFLAENTRFNSGERADDSNLAAQYAAMGDAAVFDAFAAAHRSEASTTGLIRTAKLACGGLLLTREIDAADRARRAQARPLMAAVGGAKVSDKWPLLRALLTNCDKVILGGGAANTFLAARGVNIGASLHDNARLDEAAELLNQHAEKIMLPVDVVCGDGPDSKTPRSASINEIQDGEMILDIGAQSAESYARALAAAAIVVCNGAMGVFENPNFARGSREVLTAACGGGAFSLAGGGDTLAAIAAFNLSPRFNFLSTGGGAFLQYLTGGDLPAIAALRTTR